MFKFHRTALVGALLALGAAGCGDDEVTPVPTPNPLAAVFVPQSQSVAVGAVAQYALNITGGEGTADWTCGASPAPATATKTATGCSASSTAGVTINRVNQGAGGPPGSSAVGTPANVLLAGGQLDVILNIERGTEILSKVDLLVGTTVVASQTLSAGAVAAEDGPDAQAIQEVLLSFNSACYTSGAAGAACGTVDATAGTSVVRHQNGDQAISAQLSVSGGATSLRSSNVVTYNFANVSGFHVIATLPTTNAISAATGLIWFGGPTGGSTTIAAIPVNFGASAVTQVTTAFPGCGAAVTDTTLPFSASFTCAGIETGGAGITPAFTAVAGGNAYGPGGVPPIINLATTPFPVRIDNLGPGAPLFIANPNARQNGWINANVGLVGVNTSATDNDWMVNGAADLGVGGYTRQLRVATVTVADVTVAGARAATASAAPALPAPSLGNNDYCGVASATDALNNESALPAAATVCLDPTGLAAAFATGVSHLRFGVDTTVPTVAFSGGLPAIGNTAGRLSGASVGAEFQVTVQDVGTIGNSGMNSTSSVVGTVQIARPGLAVLCLVGTGAACAAASVNAAPVFPLVPTTVVSASVVVGYYFYSAVSQDAAGNQSTSVQRVIAYDPAANVPSLTTALYNTPLTGPAVTFNANSSDNFDLRDIRYTLTYAGGFTNPLAYPATVINTVPAATAAPASVVFVNSNVAVPFTIANFVRQIEDITGNTPGVAGVTVSGAYKPTGVSGFLRDQVNIAPAGSPIVTAIPAASVTTGTPYSAALGPQLIESFAVVNAATSISTGATTPAANALVVTLNADLFGPTATFNSPFVRVDFYVYVDIAPAGAGAEDVLEQIGTTNAFTTVDDGSPFGRRHRFSLAWTPGTTSPVTATAWTLGAQTLYAVGVNSVGDALATPLNANITLTNP